MAMLAEPRRKQKWTLNPRGKQWSEDSEKFGQKMLEKMGWSSGRGLGVNEQGMTEHVRVSFKNDTAGIGFKRDGMNEAWTENQDSFNDFLQQLQKGQNNDAVQTDEVKTGSNEKSLELKSKQSKARVHYHKFTRGKDVNRYSSKDLANIFGQKELNLNKKVKENEKDNLENSDSDPVDAQDDKGGFITINGGNMADYFQRKGQNISLTPRKVEHESNSESEPEYTGFGFTSATKEQSNDSEEKKKKKNVCNYAFENPCLRLGSPENISNTNNKLEYSKKRKVCSNGESSVSNNPKKFKDDVKSSYKNGFVNAALNIESTMNEACNGKEFEVSRTQFGVTNSALDLHDEVTDKKRVTFNDQVEYSTDSVKKKKGKTMLDKFEIENKKSKKKKKQSSTNVSVSLGIINEALDAEEVSEEINDNEINERKNKKPKKRRSNHQLNLETIVETPEEDKEAYEYETKAEINDANENVIDDAVPSEKHAKKKVKKKRKKEKIDEVTINENNELKLPEIEVDKEIETELVKEVDDASKQTNQEDCCNMKKRKKLKKKNVEIDIADHEDTTKIQIQTNNTDHVKQETEKPEEETVKLKKKKKKKSKDKDKNDINTDVIVTSEQEISNKENENSEPVSSSKEEKPKKGKHKEPKENNVESIHTTESTSKENTEPTANTKVTQPSSKNTRFNANSSPWNEKARMSKKILMSLFYRNSIAHFPGANVKDIKGYGTDIYNRE